jgi:hypothetical protein
MYNAMLKGAKPFWGHRIMKIDIKNIFLFFLQLPLANDSPCLYYKLLKGMFVIRFWANLKDESLMTERKNLKNSLRIVL